MKFKIMIATYLLINNEQYAWTVVIRISIMKTILVVLIIGVAALQNANSQCLRSSLVGAPAILPAPLVESNGVAASLADTLSLLTVSSLLAEKLPLGYPMAAPIANIGPIAPIAPIVSGYGCGYESVYGYPYNTYMI